MKIFHIADLHLGKKVYEQSMIEDQRFILNQILDLIKTHKPDALIIAGDVYDRSVPSLEAVSLLDNFLYELNQLDLIVYLIAGNHDSKERLAFASHILRKNKLFIETTYRKDVFTHTLSDEIEVTLLPFIRPSDVRHEFDEPIRSYQDAFKAVFSEIKVDPNKFNLLVAHQFISAGEINPELSDSETVSVGGLDNIDASIFDDFDYVALGHLHKPQSIGRESIRYSGSILKYSLSEVRVEKSITCLDIINKNLTIATIPLKAQRDMIHLKGKLEDILSLKNDAYVYVTLTDDEEIIDAIGKLRVNFPNLLGLSFENLRTSYDNSDRLSLESVLEMDPLTLFEKFYKRQNNLELTSSQRDLVKRIMEEIHETS